MAQVSRVTQNGDSIVASFSFQDKEKRTVEVKDEILSYAGLKNWTKSASRESHGDLCDAYEKILQQCTDPAPEAQPAPPTPAPQPETVAAPEPEADTKKSSKK